MPEIFNFNDNEICKVPIWVQLPNLPLELWNIRALSKIASKLGTPKQTDKMTIARERVSYARVLVEVDITQPMKEELCIVVPNGNELLQAVRYEFVPKFCKSCKGIGHTLDRCPYTRAAVPGKSVVNETGHGLKSGADSGAKQGKIPVAVTVVQSGTDLGTQPVADSAILPSTGVGEILVGATGDTLSATLLGGQLVSGPVAPPDTNPRVSSAVSSLPPQPMVGFSAGADQVCETVPDTNEQTLDMPEAEFTVVGNRNKGKGKTKFTSAFAGKQPGIGLKFKKSTRKIVEDENTHLRKGASPPTNP